jgi:hypothetical protein
MTATPRQSRQEGNQGCPLATRRREAPGRIATAALWRDLPSRYQTSTMHLGTHVAQSWKASLAGKG